MSRSEALITQLEPVNCLAEVDAQVIRLASGIEADEISDLNLFLTPSPEIDGVQNKLRPGILRHMHHRSVELPQRHVLTSEAGLFSCRRLKGAGLYSGPKEEWLHKIRNIKKDETGLVLGLQSLEEFQGAFDARNALIQMGIETEFPLGALKLNQIIYQNRLGVSRIAIGDAFDDVDLPPEYKEIPFVIRVDAIGINHRLKDYIFAGELLNNADLNSEKVRAMLMADVKAYLRAEAEVFDIDLPDLEGDVTLYLEFILKRIYRNVSKLHRNGGVHGQLTEQNLTLDGKFIDYDTLQWLTGDVFEEKKHADLAKLEASLRAFLQVWINGSGKIEQLLINAKKEYGN